MLRKLLRQAVAIATGLVLTITMFFGIGLWRRSEDTKWCRDATADGVMPGDPQPAPAGLLEQQRSACTLHRQRQRVMFGSVWRTDGQQTAACGFELARLQLLPDKEARSAILERYGIAELEFDTGSRDDQSRFVQRCLASGPDGGR